MKHSINLILVIFVTAILFSSCENKITGDKYVEGRIVILPKSNKFGMAEVLGYERASYVFFKEDNRIPLTVGKSIYFKLKEENDLLIGYDIQKDVDVSILYAKTDFQNIFKYGIDFHDGNSHSHEGSLHQVWHIKGFVENDTELIALVNAEHINRSGVLENRNFYVPIIDSACWSDPAFEYFDSEVIYKNNITSLLKHEHSVILQCND